MRENMEAIAVLLMVRDEERNIRTTLDSVREFPEVFVYDTGSTDRTIELANEYPNVRVFCGTFVDFATSRNAMHETAEREIDREYFLLMDAGDQFVKTDDIPDLDRDVYMVKQVWQSSCVNTYYNARLIRRRCGFRYRGRVHEYLMTNTVSAEKIASFHLFQDRRQSAASSIRRWQTDRAILEHEVRSNDPPDPRDVFYLAQTYECLLMRKEAYETYRQRSRIHGGFYEERYVSMLRCGDLAPSWDKRLAWYVRSFDLINRAEPLVKIADHYRVDNRMTESWMFAKMACELDFPEQCVLYVDDDAYTYKRWHLLGIAAFYAKRYADGIRGCEMAIAARNQPVDIANLKFYTNLSAAKT